MSKQITNVMALLKSTKPTELVELEFVRDKFVSLHNQINGNERGEQEYHLQVFNYKKLLSETPALREASPLSLYGAFLDINVNQLSLEQGSKPDCYITTRNYKTGRLDEQGRDIYEKRAQLQISPYGELKMRMRAGQIKYADNPIVVYDCDHFKVGINEKGKLVVKEYDAVVNKPDDAKIIACFIRLEREDGSFEMPYLDMKDVERLKAYSNKNNYGNAQDDKSNALYTSNGGQIDTGFLKAKTIKHAFRSYPKVPIQGKFTSLEPVEEEVLPTDVDYGFVVEDVEHEEVQEVEENEFDKELKEQSKSEPEKTVVIPVSDDDDEPDF